MLPMNCAAGTSVGKVSYAFGNSETGGLNSGGADGGILGDIPARPPAGAGGAAVEVGGAQARPPAPADYLVNPAQCAAAGF